MKRNGVYLYCEIAILTALIFVSGMFKLPALLPGMEFQLSAPLAVAICVVFGFKKYIVSGIIASIIGLALGTQTIINVAIAMQFRIIVGFILWAAKNRLWAVALSGPIASTIARLSLGLFFGKGLMIGALVVALPGFIFTAIVAPILVAVLKRVKGRVVRSAAV